MVARRVLLIASLVPLLDLIAIVGAYAMARELRIDDWWGGLGTVRRVDPRVFGAIPLWLVVFYFHGLYGRRLIAEAGEQFSRLFQGISVSLALVLLSAFLLRVNVSRGWIAALLLTSIAFVGSERLIVHGVVRFLKERRVIGFRTLVVGDNHEAHLLGRTLERHPRLGYEVMGYVSTGQISDPQFLGAVKDIRAIVEETGAAAVVVAASSLGPQGLADLDHQLAGLAVRVRVSLGMPHLGAASVVLEPLDGLALVSVERHQLTPRERTVKRAFDLMVGGVLFLLTLPVSAAIAAAILVTDGRPILFSQLRVGEGGRMFRMYKFRTMVRDAENLQKALLASNEAGGTLFKMRRDPRVTWIGRKLRPLGLDELPQFWNVLNGDMSLVGPRPALPAETEQWTEELQGRLLSKPGITGLWQVSGRHSLDFDDYVRYDLFYVRNWSLALDFQIVARTVPALLSRRGSF